MSKGAAIKRTPQNLPPIPADTDPELLQVFDGPLFSAVASLASLFKVVRGPAVEGAVQALAGVCGGQLPADYVKFLQESDGAEGQGAASAGEDLILWGAAEAIMRNPASRPPEVREDWFLIGGDRAGGYVVLDRGASQSPSTWPVLHVQARGETCGVGSVLATSFGKWRELGFEMRPDVWHCSGG